MTKQEVLQICCQACDNKDKCSFPCTAATVCLYGISSEQLGQIIAEVCEVMKKALAIISDAIQEFTAIWEELSERDRSELISRAREIRSRRKRIEAMEREYAVLWYRYMAKAKRPP